MICPKDGKRCYIHDPYVGGYIPSYIIQEKKRCRHYEFWEVCPEHPFAKGETK